jgi:hypothetical protein
VDLKGKQETGAKIIMGKLAELSATIQELRDIAVKANDIANWLSEIYINWQADADADDQPAITLEEVRVILADIAREGHSAEVRALIKKHGASRLAELDSACYQDIVRESEALRNYEDAAS